MSRESIPKKRENCVICKKKEQKSGVFLRERESEQRAVDASRAVSFIHAKRERERKEKIK
jgi:hypothetical protein